VSFAQPMFLWLLAVIVPALTLFLAWAWRKKHRLIGEFIRGRLLAGLTLGISQRRQKARLILVVVVTALLL